MFEKIEVAFRAGRIETDFPSGSMSRTARYKRSCLITCRIVSVSGCGIVRNEGSNEKPGANRTGFFVDVQYYIVLPFMALAMASAIWSSAFWSLPPIIIRIIIFSSACSTSRMRVS